MSDFIRLLFSSAPFMPHGHCYLWKPEILWLGVVSDIIIAVSYFTIPPALVYFVRKRKDLAFNWIFVMFAVFILGCGATHVMNIVTTWIPVYRAEGIVKAFTAVASISTAVMIWPLIPKALKLPTNEDRRADQERLRKAYSELELRIQERTSELKKNNDELRLAKMKYEDLVNTINGIVWESEIGKSPYTFVSQQAELTLGYPIKRWLTEEGFWQKILHPEDRKKITGPLYASPQAKESRQNEYRVIAADGRTVWIRDCITLLPESSKMRGIMVDITEVKRIHEELISAKAASEVASRMKSLFLANMSHEIRTPLNAILGLSSLVLETRLTQEQKDYLKTIKDSGDSLLMLINDILDYSKIEAGKLTLEDVSFSVSELVTSVMDMSSPQANKKGLKLESRIDEKIPPCLVGDVGRILQILLNLLSNAVKFTQEGKVMLSAKGKTSRSGYFRLRIEVEDSGIGMAPDVIGRLFQPFSQADGSTARKFGGTGLGLSICKRLVDLMNGKIGVESREGKGSTFWFELELPIGNEKHVATLIRRSDAHEAANCRGKRVLVAEDNIANQKVVLRFLEKLGLHADAVANGQEAIAALENKNYDIVLMDCQMPDMDGYQAAKEIRKRDIKTVHGRIPILALTAHAFASDRRRCFDAGMDDYISKPIDFTLLEAALIRWLSGNGSPKPVAAVKAEPESEKAPVFESFPRVDRDHLMKLRSLSEPNSQEPDLIKEVFAILERTSPEKMRQIREFFESQAFEKLSRAAHAMKSTCFSAGAMRLGEICRELEKQALQKKVNPDRLKRLSEELEKEFAATVAELKEGVS